MREIIHTSKAIHISIHEYKGMDAWIYKVNGEEKYFGFLGAMFYEGGESLYLYINLSKDEAYG
jgi:hypothetical protein